MALSRQSLEYIAKRKKLNEERTEKRKKRTPKDRAKYAIEQKNGKKWMQKWIDWDDSSVPVGRRRVAFVRYLTMVHKMRLDEAKLLSTRKIK